MNHPKTNDFGATKTSKSTTHVLRGTANYSPKSERGNDENTFIAFPHNGTDFGAARARLETLLTSAPGLSLQGSSQVGKAMHIVITDGDPLCKGCVPSKLDINPFFSPVNAFAPFDPKEDVFAHEVGHYDLGSGTDFSRLYGHPEGYVGFGDGQSLGSLLRRLRQSEGPFTFIGLDTDTPEPHRSQNDGPETSSK